MADVDWGKVEWFLEDWRREAGAAFWVVDANGRVMAKSSLPRLCETFCTRPTSACLPPCPYGVQQLRFSDRSEAAAGLVLHMGGFYDSEAQLEMCLDELKDTCAAGEQEAWRRAVQDVPVLPVDKRNVLASAANSFAQLVLAWQACRQQPAAASTQRDVLTGLYNRTVWEEQLLEIEQRQSLPVAIIVGDIDGLKFVNETLGVEVGNRILERTAALLRRAFLGQGLLARIGGDSFGVVCTGLSLAEAEDVMARLRKVVEKPCDNGMAIGMSFGLAFGGSLPLVVRELRWAAENAAMQEKQTRQRTARHNVVRQVVERLRAYELTQDGRPGDLEMLALTLGKALGLPNERLHQLHLLLHYHAIGKAVFDNALVYHAATQGEREEHLQQQHASVGYRLALTLPDAAPVAGLILKQHEHWDGSGYPLGLVGEEIPLECRILSVVKQYDALRYGGRGQAPRPDGEVPAALRFLSGQQLDPRIVDALLGVLAGAPRPLSEAGRE